MLAVIGVPLKPELRDLVETGYEGAEDDGQGHENVLVHALAVPHNRKRDPAYEPDDDKA